MTALILLLIPAAILAIFLVPKSKSDIPDDVTVGVGDLFPKDSAIQSKYGDCHITSRYDICDKFYIDSI